MSGNMQIFMTDKFLGINESASGAELKAGEAERIENFTVTDDFNLRSRPGIRQYWPWRTTIMTVQADFLWSGHLGGKEVLLWTAGNCIYAYSPDSINENGKVAEDYTALGRNFTGLGILQSGDKVYFLVQTQDTGELIAAQINWVISNGYYCMDFQVEDGNWKNDIYIPRVITGCSPSGGGTSLEKLNILTNKFRVLCQAENQATSYVLPEMVSGVEKVSIAGFDYDAANVGSFDASAHMFTFSTAPTDGAEVEFICVTEDGDLAAARERFAAMTKHEYYNGSTDTRIFFYGDNTNICYYTGEPAFGAGLYVPAGNEICVDFSDSPITAMVRHYSRLLVYKPDGVAAITYEPVTLADGSVIAGFYLRPVHRELGNDAPGQVVLVNNYPRSFSKSSLYEWRVTSTYYKDERYAKCISQKIAKTLAGADPKKLVAFDDGHNKTYYIFLNDDAGTVLVNRYELDVWTVYRSQLTRSVKMCVPFGTGFVFLNGESGYLYHMDPEKTYDDPLYLMASARFLQSGQYALQAEVIYNEKRFLGHDASSGKVSAEQFYNTVEDRGMAPKDAPFWEVTVLRKEDGGIGVTLHTQLDGKVCWLYPEGEESENLCIGSDCTEQERLWTVTQGSGDIYWHLTEWSGNRKLMYQRTDSDGTETIFFGVYTEETDGRTADIAFRRAQSDPGIPIPAAWESGDMAFGANYLRKHSGRVWLSVLPEEGTQLDMTVTTDRREDYPVKTVTAPNVILSLENAGVPASRTLPSRVHRIGMKVHRFVYYKLILRLTSPGARATVLGYDQMIRYSSRVK